MTYCIGKVDTHHLPSLYQRDSAYDIPYISSLVQDLQCNHVQRSAVSIKWQNLAIQHLLLRDPELNPVTM